jgi:membrane protein
MQKKLLNLPKNCALDNTFLGCRIYFIAYALWNDFSSGRITIRAMGLVYITLLSLVPLLALSFSVLKSFGVHNQMQPILLQMLEPLGEKGIEIAIKINGFVSNVNVAVLGAVGLVVLIYTSISLMNKIEEALNYTWKVHTPRNLVNRLRHYLSLIILGPILIFTAVGLWVTLLESSGIKEISSLDSINPVVDFFRLHLSKLISVLGFTFVYILIPNTQVKPNVAFIAAIITASCWHITGNIFAAFVVNSSSQAAIYSAFASLLVFMLWMYASWSILLFGSRTAFYMQYPQQARYSHHAKTLNPVMMEVLALATIRLITQRFYAKKTAFTLVELTDTLKVSDIYVKDIVAVLQAHHFIITSSQQPPLYILSCAAEDVTINEIKAAMTYGDKDQQQLMQDLLQGSQTLKNAMSKYSSCKDNKISLKEFALNKNSSASHQ